MPSVVRGAKVRRRLGVSLLLVRVLLINISPYPYAHLCSDAQACIHQVRDLFSTLAGEIVKTADVDRGMLAQLLETGSQGLAVVWLATYSLLSITAAARALAR
jgi:hypothetical protein